MNGMGEEIGLRNLSIFAIKFDCFFERGGRRIFFILLLLLMLLILGEEKTRYEQGII